MKGSQWCGARIGNTDSNYVRTWDNLNEWEGKGGTWHGIVVLAEIQRCSSDLCRNSWMKMFQIEHIRICTEQSNTGGTCTEKFGIQGPADLRKQITYQPLWTIFFKPISTTATYSHLSHTMEEEGQHSRCVYYCTSGICKWIAVGVIVHFRQVLKRGSSAKLMQHICR